MIKHLENPYLHIELNNGERLIVGQGNTWQYFLLFAYIVKAAKEGRFTNGFDDEGEEKKFNRILNKVYECPDAAIKAFSQLGDVNSYDAISKALEALNKLFEKDYLEDD
jgi:hypothetical protein